MVGIVVHFFVIPLHIMNLKVYSNYEEMSVATADFVKAQVLKKNDSLVCLPSGDTPTGTLKKLVEDVKSGTLNFKKARFVGLDEWVGMDKHEEGSCQHYVYNQFFHPAGITDNQVTFFNAKSAALEKECKRVDDYIFSKGPLDLVLVGVGVNGHIGLNEPGVSPKNYCHVVDLESSTKQGAQKYFSDSKVLEKGITLGLQHIMNAKTVVLIANSLKKSDIIKKIVEGPVTESIPGTILQQHQNCYFFLDKEAASKLN